MPGHRGWRGGKTPESIAEAKKLFCEAITYIGAECDVTMVPISLGDWYHKRGECYDICKEEYEKLSDDQMKQFVKIDAPEDLSEDWVMYMSM